MAIVNALGGEMGEGIADLEFINQLGKTRFFGAGAGQFVVSQKDLLPFVTGTEAWFNAQTSNRSMAFEGEEIVGAPVGKEYEISFITAYQADLSGGELLWRIGTIGSYFHMVCEQAGGAFGDVFDFSGSGYSGSSQTTVQILPGEPYVWTVRFKNISAGRARHEVYLNGVQVFAGDFNSANDLSGNATDTVTYNTYLQLNGGPVSGGEAAQIFRGFLWRNDWTTADNVPPAVPFVYDAEVASYSDDQTAYSAFGSGANEIERLEDLTVGSGVVSTTPDTSITLELSPPAGFGAAPVTAGVISTLQSRLGGTATDNLVALNRVSDDAEVSAKQVAMTEVSPNVQLVEHAFDTPSVAAQLDDLKLVIVSDVPASPF